jgi:VanZ family protein
VKKRALLIIFLVASILWALFIFSNSLQTGESSGEMSGSVTEAINKLLGAISPSLEVTHRFVRKAAHFCEFGVLSTLVSFTLYFFFAKSEGRELWCLLAIPISALVAACDETIQLFVDGRGGSVVDVLIDTSGACAAALIFLGITLIVKLRNKRTKT